MVRDAVVDVEVDCAEERSGPVAAVEVEEEDLTTSRFFCITSTELFNFMIATEGVLIVDCRITQSKLLLTYPILISLPYTTLPPWKSDVRLCEHYTPDLANGPEPQSDADSYLLQVELMMGPYDRCFLRQRTKTKIVLITEQPSMPARVAGLAMAFLKEGRCVSVHHTSAPFAQFGEMYEWLVVEGKGSERRKSSHSDLPTSISLELDDIQVMKQRKLLITQYPNAILGNSLFLGTRAQALNLGMMASMGITHIIRAHDIREADYTNLYHQYHAPYKRLETIKYLDVAVDDKLGTTIEIFLRPCVDFYSEAMMSSRKSKVLVHCNMGISRSSTIVIAILMIRERMSLRQALVYAKKCRHQVQPNYSFMKELIKLELAVTGSSTMKLSELTKMNAHYSRAHAVDVKSSRCSIQ